MIVGAILAGGQSSRMGTPKRAIVLADGHTMIEHVAAALAPVVSRVLVVGENRTAGGGALVSPPLSLLPDRLPGLGPLGGVLTLLESSLASHYLIVACDQPLLTEDLLRLLADAAWASEPAILCTSANEDLAPFPCFLPASFEPRARAAVEARQLSLRRLLLDGPVRRVPAPPGAAQAVRSFNTPADLAALGALAPPFPGPNPR